MAEATGAQRSIGPHDDADIRDRLRGAAVPALVLDSTAGLVELTELGRDLVVLFVYPHATGLPQAPVPDWEAIPGAPRLHGPGRRLPRCSRRPDQARRDRRRLEQDVLGWLRERPR